MDQFNKNSKHLFTALQSVIFTVHKVLRYQNLACLNEIKLNMVYLYIIFENYLFFIFNLLICVFSGKSFYQKNK